MERFPRFVIAELMDLAILSEKVRVANITEAVLILFSERVNVFIPSERGM